jgi:hypothetical protein
MSGHNNKYFWVTGDAPGPYAIPSVVSVDPTTGLPTPTGGNDVEFVVSPYKAVAAGTGYAIGDLIQQIESFGTASTVPTWIATVWRNVTQETTLSTAPASADIVPLAVTGQSVMVSSSALPDNAAKETGGNLEAINGKLNTKALDVDLVDADVGLITNSVIHGRCTSHGGEFVDVKVKHSGAMAVDTSGSELDRLVGKYANLKLSDLDDSTTGTTYILKQGPTTADPWLLMKLVEASGITTARYDGITNNPTITLATAWTNRATLVYGLITEA